MHVPLNSLLRFILLFALITRGASLDCEVCESQGNSCSGKMMACPSKKDTCVVALVETVTAGKKTVSSIKGCESVDVCSSPTFQLDMGNQTTYKASLVCCTGRTCNKASPLLPTPQTVLNGKQCPACYSASGVCESVVVNCTGLEKFCFDVSTVLIEDGNELEYIIKGCTTQGVCASVLSNRSPMLGEAIIKKAACVPNPTSGAARPGLLLPLFSGFLLVKILF